MSFPPEMDQRVSRPAKGRGRSRNVGNLHVINTSLPAAVSNPPEYVRTVTMSNKRNVQNPEPLEIKNIVVHKTPVATRVFTVQKDATMSFTKKKINAAKNFLKQHNKESPLKKIINTKGNLLEDYSKTSLSNNDMSSNLINNSLSSTSSSNMASNSPNGSVTSNSSNNLKSNKIKPVNSSHQPSHLDLYEQTISLAKNSNTTQPTSSKEKKDIVVQKNDLDGWVPVSVFKKTNKTKDLSAYDKNKIYVENKNSAPARNIDRNQNRSLFNNSSSKEKMKTRKELQSKMFRDSKTVRRYSSSSRHSSSRQEEERYYERRYGIHRSSKVRGSRDYERKHKRDYKESYPYHLSEKSRKARKSFHEEFEALEDVSDVPLEEDFEEVETASLEDPSKPSEIPVGFRKYKIKYLTSKSLGFFKPKRYHICRDRTVVSCLNMEEESIDVVSEAELETDNISVEKNVKNADDGKLKTTNNNIEFISQKAQNVSETVDGPVEIENSTRDLNVNKDQVDEFAPIKLVHDTSEDKLVSTDNMNNSDGMDNIDTVISMPPIQKKQEVISSSKFYYTCIPESNYPDFYQGHSLSQKHLDKWESHLIGLEYVVEVRNIYKTQAKKYYCGLCVEQLIGGNIDGQLVTNHITNFKHASTYMEVT